MNKPASQHGDDDLASRAGQKCHPQPAVGEPQAVLDGRDPGQPVARGQPEHGEVGKNRELGSPQPRWHVGAATSRPSIAQDRLVNDGVVSGVRVPTLGPYVILRP